MNLIQQRDLALQSMKLCDHCLGRQFRQKFKPFEAAQIGAALRAAKHEADVQKLLAKKLKILESKECAICAGLFFNFKKYELSMLKAARKLDFETFLLGCSIPPKVIEAEERLLSKVGANDAEAIKREINRLLGKGLAKKLKKSVNFSNPDVVFIINVNDCSVIAQINSMFVYGHYRKLERGLPQTKWPCHECGGKGCAACDNTGKQFKETVEDLISPHLIKETKGKGSKFHGHGREDRDARMLGKGRPFVLEILEPQKRKINLEKLGKRINRACKGKVEVLGLRASSKEEMQKLKTVTFDKTYEAIVSCPDITSEETKALEKALTGETLMQRTPARVLHRRADKLRKRKVISVKCGKPSDGKFVTTITAEAGTYIKELISGDNGRTSPSFSSIVGRPCECAQLDVMKIHEVKK